MILSCHPPVRDYKHLYGEEKTPTFLDGVTQAEIENHKDNYGVIDWDTVIEKILGQ